MGHDDSSRTYRIGFLPRAHPELAALPKEAQRQLGAAIDDLTREPRPTGAKLLASRDRLWRTRVGNYRVLYTIDDRARVIVITRAGHRRDVYRRL